MKNANSLFVLLCFILPASGQNLSMAFSSADVQQKIDEVTATNLRTAEKVILPGDAILVLNTSAGIISTNLPGDRINIFPNPFFGAANLVTEVAYPEKIRIAVSNSTGRFIAETTKLVPSGRQAFEIKVQEPGVYTVVVINSLGAFSQSMVCAGSNFHGNEISSRGNETLAGTSQYKSIKSGYSLGFTPGDFISYSCRSGSFITVFTDQPEYTKSYSIQFVECKDEDGSCYPVVQIGDQWWMAENLAWLPEVSESVHGSDSINSFYVYGYEGSVITEAKSTENFKMYGTLYNWAAANTACPEGWHLPSDRDWKVLEKAIGVEDTSETSWRSSGKADRKIKSISGWKKEGNGDGTCGFNALAAGCRLSNNTGFAGMESQTFFWSSTSESQNRAWTRELTFILLGINRSVETKDYGFSVRCVRD